MNGLKTQRGMNIFSGGCAEFFWLYALVQLLVHGASGKGLPMAVCFVVFWAAAAVTAIVRRRRLYVIVILLLYAALFALSSLWLLSVYFRAPGNWGGGLYWLTLLGQSSGITALLPFITIFASVVLLCSSGTYYMARRIDYIKSVRKLETGALIFFLIVLLQLGLGEEVPGMNAYILLFFLWAILFIMLNKAENWSNGENKDGKHLRLIFLFIFAVFLIIVMIMAFFIDSLRWVAETGVFVAKSVSEPLYPYLVAFLRFIFARRTIRQDASSGGDLELGADAVYAATEPSLFGEVMEKLFFGAIAMVILAAVISTLGSILRFLLAKRGVTVEQKSLKELLSAWLKAIRISLSYFIKSIKAFAPLWGRSERTIVRVYKRLVRWGTLHGVYQESYDTPLEYARKLTLKYAEYEDIFNKIVKYYYQEIYGGKGLEPHETADAKKNIRRLFIRKMKTLGRQLPVAENG